ncbi:MAG: group III truncated hemoglobin [Bacteroidia bacterium]
MELLNNENAIRKMVVLFYDKIKVNMHLGGIFHSAIGNKWDTHIETMVLFWRHILLGEMVYEGRPAQKHMDMPLSAFHFEIWLELFNQTINENFEGDIAALAKERALGIAKVIEHKIISKNDRQIN